ncbi:MAG: preprotein translocase subunit SecG [Paracoccus sp. (in: a-proteobacteria)]|nr:preprotein translocase subunit SecG [Paracoccus sp. (in: a-proteobacteria)]
MENLVLTVHLILALLLIGIVLLQRSEGGGLGLGGGGGGVVTGRQAANVMTRVTWILAAAFLVTSLTLTIVAARNVGGSSVLDQIGFGAGGAASQTGEAPAGGLNYTPPPGVGTPITPPTPEAAAPAQAATPAEGPVAPPPAN